MSKRCSACGYLKEASDFHRNARAKDGLQSQCKTCNLASQKRSRQRNIDNYKEPGEDFKKTCCDCKEYKSASEFCVLKSRSDGLASVCKRCNTERTKRYLKYGTSRKVSE